MHIMRQLLLYDNKAFQYITPLENGSNYLLNSPIYSIHTFTTIRQVSKRMELELELAESCTHLQE